MAKPRMVYFFDEAHLLFKDINKALLDKIEQVVKLVRSKGVGVYFITQSPKDIPDQILAQLGNKIQHGLRAYTPADEKAVRTISDTFRSNPEFDTYSTILNLGVGEALVSTLGPDGVPTVVEKTKILAPISMGVDITDEEMQQNILSNNAYLRYKEMFDRDSAYEFLTRLYEKKTLEAQEEEQARISATEAMKAQIALEKEQAAQEKAAQKEYEAQLKAIQKQQEAEEKARKKAVEKVARTTAGTIGRQLGKSVGSSFGKFGKTLGGNVGAELARSILGTFMK